MALDPSRSTVLFDADCALCRSLAGLAAARAGEALQFMSWQDFREARGPWQGVPNEWLARPADHLRVLTEGALIEGPDAWSFLLERHQDLSGLRWLAERLGLASQTARAMAKTGDLLRRFCWRCPS